MGLGGGEDGSCCGGDVVLKSERKEMGQVGPC